MKEVGVRIKTSIESMYQKLSDIKYVCVARAVLPIINIILFYFLQESLFVY